MAFKGEIGAAYLDSIKTGFAVGDTYRIIDAGKLGGVALPFGTFVEWKGTYWAVINEQYALVGSTTKEINNSISDVLYKTHSHTPEVSFETTAADAANYAVGHYFKAANEICICTSITNDGDVYTITGDVTDGIISVLNSIVDDIGGE